MTTSYSLLDMIVYRRPQGSRHQQKFCRRFLEPVFGKPDMHGNYYKIIGDKPRVAFMAHHDTVHKTDGRQVVVVDGDFIKVGGESNCLGADCTTGVYIILRMIEAGIPGVYVVHASEEIGCLGSAALVKDFPQWMMHVDYAISFDRMGYNSVITHQLGMRTCSDEFAESLADILDMNYEIDTGGVYTDSNEYVDFIAECTNISVGYFDQHGKNERQDMVFLELLVTKLIEADWSKLVKKRVAGTKEYSSRRKDLNKYWGLDDWDDPRECYSSTIGRRLSSIDYYDDDYHKPKKESLASLVKRYPQYVAEILEGYGFTYDDLLDEIISIQERDDRNYGM